MFIGRERELASLKEFYEKDRIGGWGLYMVADESEIPLLSRNFSKIKRLRILRNNVDIL